MYAVVPGIVKIYDEDEIEDLLDAGVSIERRRGDILLCYFPDSDGNDIVIPNSDPFSTRTHNPKKWKFKDKRHTISPTLDESVKFFDAWKIHEGIDLKYPLTGKGVVVGICDIGLDPLHPTFLDENGHSRIKRITHYKEYEGIRFQLEGDEEYKKWVTDTIEEFHATHVAGILAGNGAGSPYKGMAPEADIMVSLSSLSDFGLLMGVEDIIDYAKEVNKPAVINLSMGCYTGAHDGTSLFSQYLDLCADDAIIVLSSGNEGNNTNTLSHKFPDVESVLEFRLGNKAWDQKHMYGITDIWNDSENPLTLSICIYDDESHTVAYEYEPLTLTDWEMETYEWDPGNPLFEGLSLNGFLTVSGGVDPENGRYEVYMMYDFESSRLIGTGWAKDMISVKLRGTEGDEVDVFADGTYTRLMSISGQPTPDSHLSISDLACGFRVVSVGMYGNRETAPVSIFNSEGKVIDTNLDSTGSRPWETVIYSSYGTLRDGRALPLTVAPGRELVSGVSHAFIEANPEETYYLDPQGSPWISLGGTSMSSPYVAGFIATWLEAFPTLSVEDVLDIIEETNSHDIPEPANPRNLNGYFNPYMALRKLLDHNGVDKIEDPSSVLLPSDQVEVYNLSGLKVYEGNLDGSRQLPKGLYVVRTPFGVIKRIMPL